MIRVPQVRVVDEDGSQLGVMHTADALRLAQERGFDLVEVAPMASPPVTRLLDFGQYKYELTKREKEAKRKQRSVSFKEIRLKPKIGVGDFDTKVRRAIEFLEEGDRIKVAVQFRGRELTHPQIGRDLLTKFSDQIKDHGVVERAPLLEGKSMHISVASTHKPKVHEAPQAGQGEAQGHAPARQQAPAAGAPAPPPAQESRQPEAAEKAGPAASGPQPVAQPEAATQPDTAASGTPETRQPETTEQTAEQPEPGAQPATGPTARPNGAANGSEPNTENAASRAPRPPAASSGPQRPASTGE
jgi:translation initiation factor IF-3